MDRSGANALCQTATRREDANFLAALDQSPLPTWLSNPDYDGTYFNRAWLAFTGRSLHEEIGGGWISSIHPDDLAELDGYADALSQGRGFQVEYRLRRHDGAWRWVLDTGAPRFDADGGLIGFIGTCVDITDRRETEAALRQSESRLRLAQEGAAFGIYDWDIAMDRLDWSPEMYDLYGLPVPSGPPEPARLIEAWMSRLHPEDRARCQADLEEVLVSETADRLDMAFRAHHPERGPRWIEGRGQLLRDARGRAVRLVGVNFDVTERRETQSALIESEARFSSVAQNFPGYIFRRVAHPDGRLEYPLFIGGADKSFDFARELLSVPRTPEELMVHAHPDDRAEMVRRLQVSAARLERLELEGRLLTPGGGTRWLRSISQPHRRADGAIVWDGVLFDVTEQHEREAARERSAMMLRLSIEVAAIGTWEFDPETRLVMASAQTDALFGLPHDDDPRPLAAYLERVHPEDRDTLRDGLLRRFEDDEETVRLYRIVQEDGALRWVNTRGRMVRLSDGTQRLIGAMTDVTATQCEAEARETALSHRQTLLAELNHRMKNNLHLILSMLRLEAGRPDGAADFASAVKRIEAVADLHTQLVFSEGAGRVDFGAYLQEMADKLRSSVLAGSRITLDCAAEATELDLDRAVPLGLVVNELVTNAIKYAFPEGRGQISLRLSRASDGTMTILVEDDGRGPGPCEDPRGTGLGSRLVAGLCGQIGARIESRSLPGMRHEITLPPDA